MKKRDFGDYLQDILTSVREINEFTDGMNYDEFTEDKKTVNAVIRSLEVLGEAAKKIPHEIRLKHPDVPWRRMAGMRDKLIHEYFGVDLEKVWLVIKEELHSVAPLIQQILKETK